MLSSIDALLLLPVDSIYNSELYTNQSGLIVNSVSEPFYGVVTEPQTLNFCSNGHRFGALKRGR